MNNLEIAIEVTKLVVLQCQKAKSDFLTSLNQIFSSPSLSSPVELPVKRPCEILLKETRTSTSNEEQEEDYSRRSPSKSPSKHAKLSLNQSSEESSEIEYKSVGDLKIIQNAGLSLTQTRAEDDLPSVKIEQESRSQDDQSGSVHSQENDLIQEKDIIQEKDLNIIAELDEIIQEYKNDLIGKDQLERISKFVDDYLDMGFRNRRKMRPVLEKVDNLKTEPLDKQAKAVLSEIQGKVRKIFSEALFIEDWDTLYQSMKHALKSRNHLKIEETVKRAHNALPLKINEKMFEELSKFPKLLKKILKTSKGETSIKVSTLLKKIEVRHADSSRVSKNPEKIAKNLHFDNFHKKAINTVEAKKTVSSRWKS